MAARRDKPDGRNRASRHRKQGALHPKTRFDRPSIITIKRCLSLLLLLVVAARGAATNGTAILTSSVLVEDVHLTSAKSGEDSRLQFRILNDSTERLVLLSVTSALSASVRILARVGENEWVENGSITIPADSVLDLGSSHLRIVMERLESGLPANTTVPVQLQFIRGSLTVTAHVTKR